MRKIFLSSILLVFCFLWCRNAAFATNYYVSAKGNDTNTGLSLGNAWATINYALVGSPAAKKYQLGDTVFVAPGTYNEYLELDNLANVVVMAYDMHNRPVLMPVNCPTHVIRLAQQTHDVKIIGFVADGSKTPTGAICGIKVSGAGVHNNTFTDIEIRYCRGNGVLLTNMASHTTFSRLSVHDNTDGVYLGSHGFYIAAPYTTVEHCVVFHHSGNGIRTGTPDSKYESNFDTIRDNIIYENNYSISPRAGILVSSTDTGDVVYNNICYNNNNGIIVELHANNVKVYNNLCYNNKKYGIQVKPELWNGIVEATRNASIKNNLLYENGKDLPAPLNIAAFGIDSISAQTIDTSHNWTNTADPKFINAAAGDFHLAKNSPAINAGIYIPAVTTDFDGHARPKKHHKDTVGPFEVIEKEE